MFYMDLTNLLLKELKKEAKRPGFKLGLALIDAINQPTTKPHKKNVNKKSDNGEYIAFVESK